MICYQPKWFAPQNPSLCWGQAQRELHKEIGSDLPLVPRVGL